MNLETIVVLASVLGPVILFIVYENRQDKTEEGMRTQYNEFGKRVGPMVNPNHKTEKQRVARVLWQQKKSMS